MSKTGLALASLVAVIPAGFMLYLLIMGMMGGMSGLLMVMAGVSVVAGVGVILIPILGFIIGPKSPAAQRNPQAAAVDRHEVTEEFDQDELADADLEDDTSFDEIDYSEEMETLDGETLIADLDDEWGDDFDDLGDDDDLKDA